MMDLCLQAKMIGKPGESIATFLQKAISPPTDQTITHSLKILRDLGALNNDESFTQLGLYLADLPINVKYGKMLIYGIFFKCIDPILTIVSILSTNDPFALLYNQDERDACHVLKNKLEDGSFSDHFVLLRIFQRWNEYQSRNEFDGGFCEDNFVNSATLHRIASLRIKLIGYLRSVRLINSVGNLSTLNQYSHNWSIVKACLAAGSYPEVARIDKRLGRISTIVDPKVIVNPGSVLRPAGMKTKQNREIIEKYPSDWLIFEEKNLAGVLPMTKVCTLINSIALVLTSGRRIVINDNSCIEKGQENDDNQVELEIDNFVKFLATPVVAMALKEVRDQFNALLNKFLRNPEKFVFQENDEILIEGVVKLLEFEDEEVGFKITHPGIGARPRIVTRNYGAPTGAGPVASREGRGAGKGSKKNPNIEQRMAPVGEEAAAADQQNGADHKSPPAVQKMQEAPAAKTLPMYVPPEIKFKPAEKVPEEVKPVPTRDTPEVDPKPMQKTPEVDPKPMQKIPEEEATAVQDTKQADICRDDVQEEAADQPSEDEIENVKTEPSDENKPQGLPVDHGGAGDAKTADESKQPEVVVPKPRHMGYNQFFLAELKSPELAKKLSAKKYVLMEQDAELSDEFLDGFLEAEVNNKATNKKIVFFCGKEVVGVGGLEPYAAAKISRDRLKIYFQSDATFPVNKLK